MSENKDGWVVPTGASWFDGVDPVTEEHTSSETPNSTETSPDSPGATGEPVVDLGSLLGDENVLAGLFEDNEASSPAAAGPTQTITVGGASASRWSKNQNLETVWPLVEQLRSFVATDAALQAKAKELVLTREADVNRLQKEELVSALTKTLASRGGIEYQPSLMGAALDMLYDEIVGISVLGDLWRDDDVTEVMVDRWDRVTVECNGRLQVTDISFRSPEHANDVARSLALRVSDRSVSQKIPLVTAELPQARVTFCYGPVVRGGLSITIRKFRPLLTLDSLLQRGSVNGELVELLRDLVHSRATILVSGGTGTGKTTIINMLSSFIPDSERVVTIEDAFELQLANTHVVSLQTKEASSSDDTVSVTLSDLLRNTLRMRPDRIIVGEIREGEGALTMLAAANTGHDGTMTTLHANSPSMAVNERMSDLIRQSRGTPDDVAKRTIASAFDVVVQVTRSARGLRYISEVAVIEPSSIVAGQIIPETVFTGEEMPDGQVKFKRSGKIRPESRLGRKLAMTLVNPGRWS